MPPNPASGISKKKKKGRAPAHQNTFAFQHNPKSKTTAKILATPIQHVCRRCLDKLEWRKQYRKYKPRTQPGTCNGCKKRNVCAAYHTICAACTRNCVKAKELIQAAEPKTNTDDTPDEEHTTSSNLRACAVCVKEIALPSPDDDDEEEDLTEGMGRIRLRELRALERKFEKEEKDTRKSSSTKNTKDEEESNTKEKNHDREDNDLPVLKEGGEEEEMDDPFLKAVGGVDKLLTGAAYQADILARQEQTQ